MRTVSIPTLALLSASAHHGTNLLYLCASCEAFAPGPSISKPRTVIVTPSARSKKGGRLLSRSYGRIISPRFLTNTDDVGGSPIDSIDEIESRISAMKVVELRSELKSHGQSTNGLKKVLQERLLDFYHAKMKDLEENRIEYNANEAHEEFADDTEDEEEYEREMEFEVEEQKLSDSDADTYVIHDQDGESIPNGLLYSKQKWKKKTYLLMEDVRKLVHSKDVVLRQKGAKKAREAVRRMQGWISSSDSTPSPSFSNTFQDDLHDSYDETGEEDEIPTIIDLDSITEFRDYQRSSLLRAYNLWIHAIAKSGYDDAGHLAEQVLEEMEQNVNNGGPSPDHVTIASVMDAHAHSATVSSSCGAEAAETFLFELLEKHEEEDMPFSHDGDNALRNSLIVTCDTMLNAWAREGTIESAERAQLIVLRLEEYQRQRSKQLENSRRKNRRRISSPEKEIKKAPASTKSTKRPISYATVMNAWANVRSAEAAEQAEATLERLVQRAKVDKKENQNHDDEQSRLVNERPDTIVFNSVIRCWATSGDVRAGEKSLRLLEQMKELSGKNGVYKKDKIYFDTQPDIITYNTVISAWSHCGKKNAAPQAEKIVKELVMEQQKNQEIDSTSVVANTITFNTVLHAWSKSKLPVATDRAEKLLEYMIQSSNREIKPDVYSFTSVMDAWARSKEPNKAYKARKLLDRLIEMHKEALEYGDKRRAEALLPTKISYNTVLNACAFSAFTTPQEEQREAIRIAVDTYKAMSSREASSMRRGGNRSIVSRDAVTYGVMLKSIANLMPKGPVRSRMAFQIFQECCDDGLVGALAWNELRRAVPIKLVQETLGFKRQCGSMEVEDLPREWTAHCRERRSNKRKLNDRKYRKKKGNYNKNKSGDPSKRRQEDTTFIIERSFATGKDM